jgi:aspartate carbamoyltransferase catalytic subunit
VPSLAEFTQTHGLTLERARHLRPGAIVMHPGPMNRGVEIDSAVADLPAAVIERQVSNGVPIRMAVLYLCVTGDPEESKK